MKPSSHALLLSTFFLFSVNTSIAAEGPKFAEMLDPPEGVFCNIDHDTDVNLVWSKMTEAKIYAAEINCISEPGNQQLEVEAVSELQCDEESDGNCSVEITQQELQDALAQGVADESVELPEGEEVIWTCTARVKGLNPPGKSQNHPQTDAPCLLIPENECPAWTAEELADIGTHGFPEKVDYEDAFALSYRDYELDRSTGEFVIARIYKIGGYLYGAYAHRVSEAHDVENNTTGFRLIELTVEEFHSCRDELINHVTNPDAN
ncbi:hypothetical protein ACMXYW_06825 [Neptuniibacter sp. QD48_55]|uniref:hypothetical protein n=1 Tax=Neptuniibacter sp. QD48_55 TaxID=3398212 RepID=UPI0039F4E0AA